MRNPLRNDDGGDDDPMIAAARWHERLRSEPAPADVQAFQAWRSASPAHDSAYADIERGWAEAHALRSQPEILALRHETLARVVLRDRSPARWAVAGGIAASVAMVGAVIWWQGGPFAEKDRVQVVAKTAATPERIFRTRIGERLNVALEDGSEIHLDTGTSVKVQFTPDARRLILESGQALFDVAKAPDRPFMVTAAGRIVTAHGTRFNVRYDDKAIEVALIEGSVTIRPRDSARGTVLMRPNDRLIAIGKDVSITHYADMDRFTSWTNGMIQFDNVSLADAVKEFNRYLEVPIRLDDKASAVRISGYFPANDSASFVEALESGFPIKARRGIRGQVVLSYRN